VSNQVLIKNLYLEFPGIDGHFDRNFIDILPGEKVEIIFETESEIPNQNLKPVHWSLNNIQTGSGK